MRSFSLVLLISLFLGCSTEEKESTTKGRLRVFIPQSLAPVMIDEVNEFLSLYRENGAIITDTIVPADVVARRFVHDTSRIAFLPRPLTQTEKDQVILVSPDLNEVIVAYDAILVAVHPKNKTTEMTTTDIQKILSGTVTRWDQIAKSIRGPVKMYCQDSSEITEYLRKRLLKNGDISAKFTPTSSDLQTLRCVKKDPSALGFVALGWNDSAKSMAKILNLGRTAEDNDTSVASPAEASGNFYSPHPANLYRNYYPLKRALYMYTTGRINLAVGFGAFVATAEGQKLFLKHGLLPGTQKIKLRSDEP